jgi:hypothetical protein
MASKKDLEELLQCPICFNLATEGPIWSCNNGHHVCDTCKPRMVMCGSCRLPITTRSLQLERIRDLIPVYCQFGCNIEMKAEDIKKHEATCEERPVFYCANLACEEKLRLENLISHIDTCHSEVSKGDLEVETLAVNNLLRAFQVITNIFRT